MSPRAPFVLGTPGDVRAFLHDMPLVGWHAQRSVAVVAPALGERARRGFERRLSLWLSACGCQAGAFAGMSVLAWRVVVAVRAPEITWTSALTHLGWFLGAALAGKVAGLVVARLMLVADLRRLARAMEVAS